MHRVCTIKINHVEIMKKIQQFLVIVVVALSAFILGRINTSEPELAASVVKPIVEEMAEVELLELNGDELKVALRGDVRVVWSEENFVDGDGVVFLSQVPGAADLKYREYFYTGNANTGKFYPSTTTWARGVRVKDRRFFHTKEEAVAAGFVPSKSVGK